MTTPIKPPSGSIVSTVAPESSKTSDLAKADFRAELVTTPDVRSSHETAPATPVNGPDALLASITSEIRAGRMSSATAVEAMVARALDSPMARALTPDAQQRMEAAIRSQLANDPALTSLVSDLDRAR